MQTGLLRVLQERVYEPLGGVEPVKANVRVISATNKSLRKLVKQAEFARTCSIEFMSFALNCRA